MPGISWLIEELSAFQVGLRSMESVTQLLSYSVTQLLIWSLG
jgi:hypothetical protein